MGGPTGGWDVVLRLRLASRSRDLFSHILSYGPSCRPASHSFGLNVIVHQKNHNLNPEVYFENRCGKVCKLQRAEAQEDEVRFS